MPQMDQNPSDDVIEIDLKDIALKLFKHRHTIISVVGICVVAALIYSFTATPIYSAASRILVDAKPPKIVKVEGAILPDYTDRVNFFNSQIEILKSRTVADIVMGDMGVYEPWGRRGKPAEKLKPVTENERLDFLLKHVKVSPVRMTQVIEISVEDPDPQLAARIANNWTRAYVLFSSIDQLVQRRSELEIDLAQQLKFLKEKHPVIIGIKTEISVIDDKINNEHKRLKEIDKPRKLGALTLSSNSTNVQILDRAQPPTKPVRPRKALNVALALILGLFAGVGLVFLFESLDQTIKTATELEQFLKLTCMASLPVCKPEGDNKDFMPEFVSQTMRHSMMAEAFRGIRTGIIFSNPDMAKKTFLVTSAPPDEGKTTVAVNLATVFAQADERTLLVDADLRNPSLHKVFKIDRANGITDILALNKDDIQSFIHKTDIKNFDLLTCGEVPPNPSELLGSKKMETFIAKLSTMYDRIIFDTAPVLAATDAVVLSTKVDAVILVVKAASTHSQAALRALNALRSVHAHVLGAVLNMVNVNKHDSYSYFYRYGQEPHKNQGNARNIMTKLDPRTKKS